MRDQQEIPRDIERSSSKWIQRTRNISRETLIKPIGPRYQSTFLHDDAEPKADRFASRSDELVHRRNYRFDVVFLSRYALGSPFDRLDAEYSGASCKFLAWRSNWIVTPALRRVWYVSWFFSFFLVEEFQMDEQKRLFPRSTPFPFLFTLITIPPF